MKAIGFFTTGEVKSTKQNYKSTSLDSAKKEADLLVIAIDDKYSLFVNNKNLTLKGRGIEIANESTIVCTEKAFEKLSAQYNVVFDL